MFDSRTFENLLEEKLKSIPEDFDKREGSVIYNALAPNSFETQQFYLALQWVYEQLNPRTADYEHLIRWAEPFGITPHSAEFATIIGDFDVPVEMGARFNLGSVNFSVINPDTKELMAEEARHLDINVGDRLSPIEPINGLTKAVVKEVVLPGRDFETHQSFLERCEIELQREAYGGNIADYERMVSNIQGVGSVLVKPTFKGPGTVGIVILDSDYNAPATELIEKVQNEIDPPGFSGQGMGLAPIDHKVTVTGAKKDIVNIVLTLSYKPGYSWDTAEEEVKKTIEEYFREIRKDWRSGKLVVYISQIESRILRLDAISDIGHTKINGLDENYNVKSESIPIVGSVTV